MNDSCEMQAKAVVRCKEIHHQNVGKKYVIVKTQEPVTWAKGKIFASAKYNKVKKNMETNFQKTENFRKG